MVGVSRDNKRFQAAVSDVEDSEPQEQRHTESHSYMHDFGRTCVCAVQCHQHVLMWQMEYFREKYGLFLGNLTTQGLEKLNLDQLVLRPFFVSHS
jgi:hypothetical protein